MIRFFVAILLSMFPGLSLAEDDLVSPSEFRKYAEGYTLYFEHDGLPFGAEQFLSENETIWRYRDGSCVDGEWRTHGAQLCFLYGEVGESDVLCWRVLRDKQGMKARLLSGDSAGLTLRILGRDKRDVSCAPQEPTT